MLGVALGREAMRDLVDVVRPTVDLPDSFDVDREVGQEHMTISEAVEHSLRPDLELVFVGLRPGPCFGLPLRLTGGLDGPSERLESVSATGEGARPE